VRVAGIEEFGGGVTVLEVPDPRAPRTGEVLIEVKAAGVGNWDEFARTGRWDLGRGPPMALGVAAAGVVAALGAGLEGWSVGDPVFTHPLPLAEQGCWAPWLVAEAALLAPKPAEISWTHAAAFPVPALTAVQVLDEGLRVNRGEWLLVNGAGGATGTLIVSMAALRGVEVIATAGPRSRERVIGSGAATVIDYHDPDWTAQVVAATAGHGVDAAANAAPVWSRSLPTRPRASEESKSSRCTSAPTGSSSRAPVKIWPPDGSTSSSARLSPSRRPTRHSLAPLQEAEPLRSRSSFSRLRETRDERLSPATHDHGHVALRPFG
jgi:D-arabinose 1-dehydrogenase-like Zn-dependent alcohol dehydrogenase